MAKHDHLDTISARKNESQDGFLHKEAIGVYKLLPQSS